MAMKTSLRIPVAGIASVLLILLLNTCGIESYLQLNPPEDGEASGDKFSFWKSYYNSESEFRGFDLYYKMYLTTESPDFNKIIEFEDLAANGFWRIHASSDVKEKTTQRPLIPIKLNDRTPPPPPFPGPAFPIRENDLFPLFVDFTGTPPLLDPPYPRIVDDGYLPSPNDYGLIDAGDTPIPPTVDPPILINITDIFQLT